MGYVGNTAHVCVGWTRRAIARQSAARDGRARTVAESRHLFVCTLRLMEELGGTGCRGRSVRPPVYRPALRQGRMPHGTYRGFGQRMNPDIEKLMALHPDAVMLSPFENSGGYAGWASWTFPSSNVPTIWKPLRWGVPNGCVSTACCSEKQPRPILCLPG